MELSPPAYSPPPRCAACGMVILDDTWSLTFTTYTIGWTSSVGDRQQTFAFHQACYPSGKAKLIDALKSYKLDANLKGLGAGNAWLQLDQHDREAYRWPDGKLSSADVPALGDVADLAESIRGLFRTLAEGWRSLPRFVRVLIQLVVVVLLAWLMALIQGA